MIETDVIVVGGGPAGASCAWQLKRHHLDCLVLDQARFPRFKPCAGWMSPEAVRYIHLDSAEYPHSFTKIDTFHNSIHGLHLTTHATQYAIRRIEFDNWLLERSGAPVYEHTVKSIVSEGGRYIIDGEYAAKYLVGAGGTYCPVYRTLFKAEDLRSRETLIAAQEDEFEYPYNDADGWLWFFENKLPGYAWYVPKNNGFVNVGVGGMAERMKANGDSLKRHWDLLVKQLDTLGLVRGYDYHPSAHSYYLRRGTEKVRKGNAFLVGDAAGLATSDLGEGIGASLRSGQLAADAIARGGEYSVRSIPRYSLPSMVGQAMVHFGLHGKKKLNKPQPSGA